ncbi:MAG TPA: AMP-binding protein [Solirubrobacteraceae bacterium]|nr:AMP-binding protein [Solirubrobacteraceae bacterium]
MQLVDDVILARAHAQPDRTAITDARTGRALTYGQVADGARRLAAGLGVGRGDVVSIVAGNSADHAVALYGALAAGAAIHHANPALTSGELARQFAMTWPSVVIADEQARVAATAAAERDTRVHALERIGELLAAPRAAVAGRLPSDLAHLFPSSGTTGLPKIAAHSHAGSTAALRALAQVPSKQLSEGDVVGIVIPFSHLFGSALLHHALSSGAAAVTLDAAPFDFEAFLRMLQDHAVTVAPVTPPILRALAAHPLVDRFELSGLQQLVCSAAPCPPDLLDAVSTRLGCEVTDNLGSTEAWGVAMSARPPVRGSVGRIVPDLEAAIVDCDTGRHLGPGEAGELWLRGPAIMQGYLGSAGEPDGWLRTGDLCTLDAAGNLFVVDRLKDMIKVGGYSVSPAEVELELTSHPAVADAAVVGRPDPALGEVPVAYVSLCASATPDALRDWLSGRLAPWKQVSDVVIVDRVARNPAGKLLRRAVAAQAVG